jgi:protein-S-isoprenylcysteine O-methyltransferase Ste14
MIHDASTPPRWALIPPPLMFAIPLLIGLWLSAGFPIAQVSAVTARRVEWLGIGLIVAGILHVLTSVMLFVTSRTTIIPHHRASTLVQGGAYKWTRNPMYLGLTLIYAGISLAMVSAWPLILLPVPLLVMDRVVIPLEERHMEDVFGAEYSRFKSRVRRWL